MHELIYRALYVVLAWKLFWFAVYNITGFHLSYFSFSNGFVLNGICFDTSKLRVRASSLKLRYWGSIRVTISDIEVEILPRKNTKKEPNLPKGPARPRKLVPRLLQKWALRWFPAMDVELKFCKFKTGNNIVEVESLRLSAKGRPSSHREKVLRFTTLISGRKILCNTANAGDLPPMSIGTFTVLAHPSVDTETGIVSRIIARIYMDDLEIQAFPVLRTLLSEKPNHRSEPGPKLQTRLDTLLSLHEKIQGLHEISFNAGNLRIKGIPFFPASQFCSLDKYLGQDEPETSITLSVKSMSFHCGRVQDTSAGFEVLFNASDKAFHITTAVLLLQLSFVTKKYDDARARWYYANDEFLNVPSFTVTTKTNIINHLAKGNGFKNCVLELFLSLSSPVLDLTVEQCALLAYNYVLVRKLMKLRKLRGRAEDSKYREYETDEEDTTKTSDSLLGTPTSNLSEPKSLTLVDKVVALLNETYPNIDVKLIVEQPRTVIRLHDTNTIQMLSFSYSLLYLHVFTTPDNDYDARCHCLHPCWTYTEKRGGVGELTKLHHEVLGFLSGRLLVSLLKNLKVKSKFALHGPYLNLNKADTLNGINQILTHITNKSSRSLKNGMVNKYYNSEILKECELYPEVPHLKLSDDRKSLETMLFASLPPWLVSFEFSATNVDLKVGSTSPLLPPDLIAKLSRSAGSSSSEIPNIVQLGFSNLSVVVANNESEDIKLDSTTASSSLETLASENQAENFWKVNIQLKELSVAVIEGTAQPSPVLDLPAINASVSALSRDLVNKILLDLNADDLIGSIDKYKVFILLGLVHLLMQTIVAPLKRLRKKFRKDMAPLLLHEKKRPSVAIVDYLSSEIHLQKCNFVVGLSDDFKVRLQLFGLSVVTEDGVTVVRNNFARLLADSALIKGHWNRLLCVDSINVKFNDPEEILDLVIESPLIRMLQPHRFVVYKLFDNLSVFLKIVKHLVRCLKESEKAAVVCPKESRPLKVPKVGLKTKKLVFSMEDDPFEAELNMIYQLGLTEQRKRRELMTFFDERARHTSEKWELPEKFELLQKTMASLWIRKVKIYKSKLTQEILDNENYLFGNELLISESDNHHICSYTKQAPLLSVILAGLNLDIASTKFSLEHIPDFIYNLGQQVPKHTRYSLMIPTFLDLGVEEVRMHLRDYPLPLLHLPRAVDTNGNGRALLMQGHLLITESLVLDEKHLRKLKIQLSKTTDSSGFQPNRFDNLIIERSLSTVKLFTDLDVLFDSNSPSRFVWGQSYQFGIQQIMLNMDQFSKPPLDPSPKLGFWDKMRLLLHGKFSIAAGEKGSIEIAFKGGHDPYNLFADSSGFVLAFRDEVRWKINENDDSLLFFDVQSKLVSWYIPNYSIAPLISWTRDSTKPTFLPNVQEIVTSSFGYFLHTAPSRAAERGPELPPEFDVHEKKVVELSGGVKFTLGFLLQRKTLDGKGVTNDCKPHYEVELCNPDHTGKEHDSYEGFRSLRLHMALSLVAHNEESYNTIHLSPGTFKQFFSWWAMFNANTMLPIRRGKLFGESKNSAKFSKHLFTNKFLFRFKNLFIGHTYRDEALELDEDFMESVGLRAKVSDFSVDLHQRKEERISVHADLSRNKKIMKMGFNLGEVVLSKIDLRVVYAKALRNLYNQVNPASIKCKYDIFDADRQWFDGRDFEEAFVGTSKGAYKKVDVLPLLYSERFSYIRDTSDLKDENEWGSEETHECKLRTTEVYTAQMDVFERRLKDLENQLQDNSKKTEYMREEVKKRILVLQTYISESGRSRSRGAKRSSIQTIESGKKENFHNRFILVSMFLKWNLKVRNLFLKYLHFVQFSANLRKYLSYDFVRLLEGIIDKRELGLEDGLSLATSNKLKQRELNRALNKFETSQHRLDNFDETVRSVKENEKILEDYKIEIIAPQIQLHTEEVVDSVVIISAPVLEAKIFSVVTKKDSHLMLNTKELETRYGVLLHDASVMVIHKEDLSKKTLILEKRPYGTTTNWPPWLGVEICKNSSLSGREIVLVENMSMMLTYDQIMALGSSIEQMEGNADIATIREDEADDSAYRLRVDVPQCTITSTSKQYFALYVTVLSLLLYSEPMSVHLRLKLLKLKFSINFQDFSALHSRLITLHDYLSAMELLLNNYTFRHSKLNNEALNEYLLLKVEKENVSTEIFLMLQSLFTGDLFEDSTDQTMEDWRIAADKIVLHMLQDNREPILDMVIDQGRFKRIVKGDGSNDNRIEIRRIEGLNLVSGAFYKKFLVPMRNTEDDDMVTVDWSMNRSIGGIRILENFDISSQPLNIKLDEITGRQLMKFIFQTDNEGEIDESPLLRVADRTLKAFQEDDEEQDSGDVNDALKVPGSKRGTPKDRSVSFSSKRTGNKSSFKESSVSSGSTGGQGELQDEVDKMILRSKKYLSIASMRFRSFEVMISLKLKTGFSRWLNVTNFLLEMPEQRIDSKILSMFEIANLMKKLVIKALLRHSGRIIKNKLTTRLKNATLHY